MIIYGKHLVLKPMYNGMFMDIPVLYRK